MTTLRQFVRRPFRGTHYYEWQIGPLVFQAGRRKPDVAQLGITGIQPKRFHMWRDPYWNL